ncbi:MAG: DNA mismatch repair protein MutH [Clostridia bacterium]|nr:DNA mismatch repair protein MutH [Clostridia bacterium]
MKLKEAQEKILTICNIPFSELFDEEDFPMIIKNKGKVGQLLEMALGKKLDNCNLDFEDGELKSNKCDASGKPLETVFITQIASVIDELLEEKPFKETHLYEKISNILYVPVCKIGKPRYWMFLDAIHIDLSNPRFFSLLKTWENDYYSICRQLKNHIETSRDGYIHTSNGTHIQVRSKDLKPYHPIYSEIYGRNVSNKNHAFYFQKQFVYDIRKMSEL